MPRMICTTASVRQERPDHRAGNLSCAHPNPANSPARWNSRCGFSSPTRSGPVPLARRHAHRSKERPRASHPARPPSLHQRPLPWSAGSGAGCRDAPCAPAPRYSVCGTRRVRRQSSDRRHEGRICPHRMGGRGRLTGQNQRMQRGHIATEFRRSPDLCRHDIGHQVALPHTGPNPVIGGSASRAPRSPRPA